MTKKHTVKQEHWQFSLHQTYWSPFSSDRQFSVTQLKKLSDKTICEFLRLCTSLSSLGLGPNMQKWWFAPPMPLQLRANQTHLVVCGLSRKRRLASLYRFEMIWVSYCTGPAFCPFFRVPMGALFVQGKTPGERMTKGDTVFIVIYCILLHTLCIHVRRHAHSTHTEYMI